MFNNKHKHNFKFDLEHKFEERKAESEKILKKYPDRIPIIVEPSVGCKMEIDKKKYLVPKDLSMGQFLYVIRKRLKIPAEKALFLFVDSKVPPSTTLLLELYGKYADKDGFLKTTFNEENVFG